MCAGDHSRKRRPNHFSRRCGNNKERELAAVESPFEKVDERSNVGAQPHTATGLLEMLLSNAAELRIVPNQIRELSTLLHEVRPREAIHFLLEVRRTYQLTQHDTRVVEAQGLIEIRRHEKMSGKPRRGRHAHPSVRQCCYISIGRIRITRWGLYVNAQN